ncbi:PLP-dependent aminotransferase family protein, partial [Clostridioides difficile]
VYDMLLADGYVHAHRGRGTFVTETLSIQENEKREAVLQLSPWGERVQMLNTQHDVPRAQIPSPKPSIINFQMQRMPAEHFPLAEWKSALAAVHRSGWREPSGAAGDPELREA